ncbi:MAG: DoxX family protein [Polaromonas sp.]|nr:DoxX family protein [Polaromonas sp.]
MFTSLQNPLSLIGRVLLALLFIPAGFGKIGGFAGAVGYAAAKGVPLPELAIAIAIAVELGLGLLLLVGFQTRWAALGIAFFTFVITFIFHPLGDPAQMQAFFKNMAIVGGLLSVAAWGGGGFSVDAKRGA